MKRLLAAVAAAVALGTVAWVAPAAAATSPYCGIRWGSLPKEAGTSSSAHLTNVRAGQHACYDRLVLDLDGRAPGHLVSYVSQFVTLVPGDIIFTGTPGETRPMKPGDVIEVEVEGVGVLRNQIA